MSDVNPPVNLSGPALSKIYVVPEGAIAIAGSPEKGIGKFIVSFPLDEILFNPHCSKPYCYPSCIKLLAWTLIINEQCKAF